MKIFKAHTNGNDFVIIYLPTEKICESTIRKISDRHFGIGCDQVIIIHNNLNFFELEFFNQDGSFASMCGNGTAAAAKCLQKILNITENLKFKISNTFYKTTFNKDEISVTFPLPIFLSDNIISTGNKHIIFNFDVIDTLDKTKYADYNIHFVKKENENTLRIKTFERGVGWTLGCGSGAVAVGFQSKIEGLINIKQDGGCSKILIESDNVIYTCFSELIFECFIFKKLTEF